MKIFKTDDYAKLSNPTPGEIFRREILGNDDHADELGGLFGIIVAHGKGDYHFHNRRESLLLIISGEAAEYVEGKEYPIKAGDVLFIPPGEKHTIVNHSDHDLHFLEFFTHPPVAADKISVE